MKSLELKFHNIHLLIIEVPVPFTDVSIGTHCIGVKTPVENVEKDSNGYYHIYSKGLFFGDIGSEIELIGKGSELSEEQAKQITIAFQFGTEENPHIRYIDFKSDFYHKNTALESFISLIEAHEFSWGKNPLGEYDKIDFFKASENTPTIQEWRTAEDKTFNLEQTLIFQKKIAT